MNNNYKEMKIEDFLNTLETNENGLTSQEALKRLVRYGKNELPKKKKDSIFKIFIGELIDPIVLLLLVAIIASLIASEYIDALAIFLIVLIDLILGTYQENKARQTIESLAKLVPENVKVKRNGKEILINATDLTIGDYVFLESGDKISADMRLIEVHNFSANESILTGESVAIFKSSNAGEDNLIYAGTSVQSGRGIGIVTSIGINTEIGKIATTLNETKEEKSPLAIRVNKFSKQISLLIGLLAIILTIVLSLKGMPFTEIVVSVIALSVSAMPEGLPLALTMALTIASNKMAKKNVIVKKLNYVESLGSTTVIASDKTGTLTVNEQTAKKILLPNNMEYDIEGSGYHIDGKVIGNNLEYASKIAKLGVINNEAKFSEEEQIGDSIDIAFLVLGEKLKVKTDDIDIIDTIPYESENKYSAVFYKHNDKTYCTIKGSLETVMAFCNRIDFMDSFNENVIEKQNEELSSNGYRVLAIASGEILSKESYSESDIKSLTFNGLVGFIDPIRKEAHDAINKCLDAGIKVLMITGDHPLTAFKIANDLELSDNFNDVTTGDEVSYYYEQGEKAFDEFIKSKKIFTRVSPINKLRIVESLKRQGEFVAVTGDGVNDAPALKAANIGIAMGSGTDIAKETAKMIVIDDNFSSIVKGVLEGRVAYANIRKITYFLISCGLAEVLFFVLAIIFNMPIPLVAIQLLWLNVVTDGIQDIALSFEKAEDGIMMEKPRKPQENLFDRLLAEEILISGLFIGLMVFALWYFLINGENMNVRSARSYTMVLMIIMQNIHAFNCRSEKKSTFKISLKNNPIFLLGVLGSLILGIAVINVNFLSKLLKTSGMPLDDMILLILFGTIIILVMELYKIIRHRRGD